jgi:hypothetical protein
MYAFRACSARRARSSSGSTPSGSASRSNLARKPLRPGSVRAVRSAVRAHDTWAGRQTMSGWLSGRRDYAR